MFVYEREKVKEDLLQVGCSQSALFLRVQWERWKERDKTGEKREEKMNVVN